jgi:pantoate kinase
VKGCENGLKNKNKDDYDKKGVYGIGVTLLSTVKVSVSRCRSEGRKLTQKLIVKWVDAKVRESHGINCLVRHLLLSGI